MTPRRVMVVGGGLMGGSIGAALKRRPGDWFVTCSDLPGRIEAIKQTGLFDEVISTLDLGPVVPDCRLLVIATPVDTIAEVARGIMPRLRQGTVVTDVGSTKQRIVDEVIRALPDGIRFVGGHPVTGSERSGIEAADPLLFRNRPYVLCPCAGSDEAAMIAVMDLVDELGAIPVSLDPEEHDRVMAMVSHLPQILAVALMNAVGSADARHGILDLVAGRGFREMTRLAVSNHDLWHGILASNLGPVSEALDRFETSLGDLRTAIEHDCAVEMWDSARRSRMELYPRKPERSSERDLRGVIDGLDEQMLQLLARRFAIARQIGEAKDRKGLEVNDPAREERLLRRWSETGNLLGLPGGLVDDLFPVITGHSKKIQTRPRRRDD